MREDFGSARTKRRTEIMKEGKKRESQMSGKATQKVEAAKLPIKPI